VVERGLRERIGGWLGRRLRGFSRWVTRHFGSEEPQRSPPEGDYLGVPRLPRAAELREPRVEPDSFVPPLGTPIIERVDSAAADSLLDATRPRPDTMIPRVAPPVRDSARPVRPDTLPRAPPDTLRAAFDTQTRSHRYQNPQE
jgi:hypothetical protein